MKTTGIHYLFILTLSIFLGLGIFTPSAEAQVKQIDLILKSYYTQSFASLLEQAASVAENYIEREFAENSSLEEVKVMIMGDRQGQIAPILIANVSRSNWQQEPIIQKWSRYFSDSGVLLGFLESQAPQPTPRVPPANYDDGRGFDDEDD